MTIDRNASPYNGRVLTVLLSPSAIAHDRDGLRSLAIISGRKHAPRVRANAKHGEVVSRNILASLRLSRLFAPDAAHAYQVAIDVASLAPNADISVYPWKDPPELKARTINRVRSFLKGRLPQTAAR